MPSRNPSAALLGRTSMARKNKKRADEDQGYAPPAPSKGLGPDGPGDAVPNFLKTRPTPAGPQAGRSGLAREIVTARPRRPLGRLGEGVKPEE